MKKQTIETPEYLKFVARIIKAAGRRVGSNDEHELAELASLRSILDQSIKAAIQEQLAQGKSWSKIGLALGITKQAAFQKWS